MSLSSAPPGPPQGQSALWCPKFQLSSHRSCPLIPGSGPDSPNSRDSGRDGGVGTKPPQEWGRPGHNFFLKELAATSPKSPWFLGAGRMRDNSLGAPNALRTEFPVPGALYLPNVGLPRGDLTQSGSSPNLTTLLAVHGMVIVFPLWVITGSEESKHGKLMGRGSKVGRAESIISTRHF